METAHFNIVSLFTDASKSHPDRTAIIEKNKQITFDELAKEIDKTASYFQQKGISKGDRVLVFVPMGIDLYRIVLALFKIGATAVFLDEWVSFKRLNLCCKIAECNVFIGILKARILSYLSSEIRRIPIKLGTAYKEVNYSIKEIPSDCNDTALITFTTGSSGTPKAAKRTHGFLKAQFEVLEKKIDSKISKIDMPVLPIVLMINLGKGLTSVIADFKASKPASLNPEKILNQIEKHQVGSIASSPYFVLTLAKHAIHNKQFIPNINRIFTGGAAVFPHEAEAYVKAFPNADSKILYGSTEAEPISSIDAKDLAQRNLEVDNGLYVGEIDASSTVLIIPIEDKSLEFNSNTDLKNFSLADGEIGEIIVSGSHVLKEYINNPEAMKRQKLWVEGTCWHRTGDSGFKIDQNLFLTGPCNAMIKSKSGYLSPFLYEQLLTSIQGVKSGTLLRIENSTYAIVQKEPSDDSKSIVQKVMKISSIDDVLFIEKMPKDPRHNSKIDYAKLREMISLKPKN